MSARDLNRARRENRRAARQGAREAGKAIAAARLQRRREQIAELGSSMAYKDRRQKGRREAIGKTVTALAGLYGGVKAADQVATLDTSKLEAQGVSHEDMDLLLKMGHSAKQIEAYGDYMQDVKA